MSRVAAGPTWVMLFLASLAEGAPVARAARFAGVARRTAYDRRERSDEFRMAWDDAAEVGRLARIHERTPWLDGAPDQLASRLRSVSYMLDRHGLAEFADEVRLVARQFDRFARELRRDWLAEHGLAESSW